MSHANCKILKLHAGFVNYFFVMGDSSLKYFNQATVTMGCIYVRKQNVLRYQRGNQKPHIEEQTIQWICGKTTIY